SNPEVATIDALTGVATARAAATPTITATSGGRAGSATLGVGTRPSLLVNLGGSGGGTVASDPPGIDCGASCSAPYDQGTVVTLVASAATGSTFAGWTGCDTVTGATCTVTMTTDRSATATFALPGDTTPPARASGQPAGTLPAGTTQTTLSLVTGEAASCRYATSPGLAYGAMPGAFTTTGGTSHATTVGGLANGGWYAFPAVADLDGDGQPDVVWGSSGDVVALRGDDGSLKWRQASSGRVWPGIAVGDLRGDGRLEVVVGRDADRLTVYDGFGNVVWTRNPFGGGSEVRTLALADLENAGRLQIIAGRADFVGTWPRTAQLTVFESD